jgi:catechol 2,3-dioxygenase-like lactoylglutathione lyase family enzyme
MISGGNTTITVSNMDAAIRFYTDIMGLRLTNRIANRWATLDVGPSYWTTDEVGAGLFLALQQASKDRPAPGTKGSVTFGVETYAPLEGFVERLKKQGVHFTSEIIRYDAGKSVSVEDPDGNRFYLQEFPPFMLEEEDREENPAEIFTGGHALVFISNMDAAVRFYRDVLGMRLTNRYDPHWATVEAGNKLVLGLHPESPHSVPPGTPGSMMIGLDVDAPIDQVVSRLAARGVKVKGAVIRSEVQIEDPDGNAIVLRENESIRKKTEKLEEVNTRS